MILILLGIVAAFLLLMAFFLIKKNRSFLALIGDSSASLSFLKQSGLIFIILATGSLAIGFLNSKFWAILYLAVIIFYSGIFSLSLSKKIKDKP